MTRPSDPVETPPPRQVDPLAQSLEGIEIHAECLHPELIDYVRQERKERPDKNARSWTVGIAVVTLMAGSIGGLATCLYSQGQASGATAVRVTAVEDRAREDRAEAAERAERQRQRDEAQAVRETELVQALHALDSRLGRIEERLPPRR